MKIPDTNVFPSAVFGGDSFQADIIELGFQTVAFHENGHALGLGHFGKVFGTISNLTLHIAPRAAMNGYCGLYGSWPN